MHSPRFVESQSISTGKGERSATLLLAHRDRVRRWVAQVSVIALVAALVLVFNVSQVTANAGGAAAATAVSPAAVGPRPNATRIDFQVGDRVSASVDVGTGNLMVTTTDLTLPGIGDDVQLGQTFNSLLLAAGSPLSKGTSGFGWAARLGSDNKLIVNTDGSIVYLAPGGNEGKYTPSGSGYTTPAGFKNTLVKTGTTGWTLTEHGSNTVSTFNTAGRLTKITDRNGQPTNLYYNSGGQVGTLTTTRGGTNAKKVTLTTNSTGLLGSMTQASDVSGSRSVSYTYVMSQLNKLTDAKGRVTTFGYTGATSSVGGNLTKITNTGGVATTFAYDSSHRVTSVSRANPGKSAVVTRFAYPSGTTTLVAGPNTDQAQPVTSVPRTTYTLDSTDRVTKAVDPLNRTRSTSYTPLTDVASVTSGGGGLASAEHGANNGESLTKVTSPTGASMSMSYTGSGTSQYLPNGVTDAQGNAGTSTYDGLGNQTSSTNSAAAATASVTYNTDGTLATSKDPAGKTTTYTRNTGTHQITGITPPSGAGLGSTSLTYDGYARLATVTDGRGVVATYSYDQLDRVTGITWSGGYPITATTPVTYTYDTAGNLATRTDASGTTTFGYDGLNRLTNRKNTASGGDLTYGYDRNGNITSFTNTRGFTSFVYDSGNQLIQRNNPQYLKDYYAYNTDGKRTDTWWRANATHTSYAARTHTDYDQGGRVARTWTSRNSSDTTRAFDTSYCYTKYVTGTPCSTTKSSSDTTLIQWSVDNLTGARSIYTYDGSNRLTAVSNFHGHNYAYTYDANGNRATAKVDGASTQSLTFNAGNQITTTGYGFDTAGNQTGDPTNGTIRYNQAGQTIAAKGASASQYTYAGPGQNELIRQELPGSVRYDYTYGINSPNGVPTLDRVAQYSAITYVDNDPTTGQPQAITLPSGTESDYLATDGNGSVVALISSNTGNPVAATYIYDPYGTVTATTGNSYAVNINPFRHTGGTLDPHTGWTRHGTRYNDTTTGRWSSTDPITRLNDPDQANPYAFAASNPCNRTDPTGRLSCGASIFFLATSIAGVEVSLFGGGAASIASGGAAAPVAYWALGLSYVGFLGSLAGVSESC